MRYSRFKKKKNKQRYAAFLLIAVLLIGSLYVLFAGTMGKFLSNLISPILSSFDKGDEPQDTPFVDDDEPKLIIPDKTTTETVKVTDTIKASPLSMKAIQLGAFTTKENAAEYSKELRTKGGAGYIIEDAFFRVLGIGFLSDADARQVKDQLSKEGIESHLFDIVSPGANMQITATQSNVKAIKLAFAAWEETYLGMENTMIQLDSGEITSHQAYETMKSFNDTIQARKEELNALAANQDGNKILSGLSNMYNKGSLAFSNMMSENSSNMVAISANIKYTYIDMVYQYKLYMEQITK